MKLTILGVCLCAKPFDLLPVCSLCIAMAILWLVLRTEKVVLLCKPVQAAYGNRKTMEVGRRIAFSCALYT
jgi:hypothetical protein